MQSSKQKELAKGVFIYAIGTFGTKFLSFLIVPLYTYYISTTDMGVYDVLMATVSLLAPLITLQISDAAYKWILQNELVEEHIRSTTQVLFLNCTITLVLIFLINHVSSIPYCAYFAIILVLSRIFETIQKLLRGLKRQKLFAIAGIVYSVVFLTLNVIQIVYQNKGIVGLFNSAIIANSVAILLVFAAEKRLRQNIFSTIDIKMIVKMLKFSIPLIPNYMNWWVINSSDKYIVNYFLGPAANGVLAIAHKFPTILQTILGLFNNSWQDVSIAETKNTPDYNTFVFKRLYRFALGLLFPLIPATKLFILWSMSLDYKRACDYVAFYYIGIVFQAFSSFFGVGYLRNNQTKKAFSTSVYGAAINALSNIVMIRFLGMQAAALSTFFGFFFMWIVRVKQNKEELGIGINWKEVLWLTTGAIVVALSSILLPVWVNYIMLPAGVFFFCFINRWFIMIIKEKGKSFLHKRSKLQKDHNNDYQN